MTPHRTKKNRAVWKKNPGAVGEPPLSAIGNIHPNTFCVILKVSGIGDQKEDQCGIEGVFGFECGIRGRVRHIC